MLLVPLQVKKYPKNFKYTHLSLTGLWSKRYAVKGESYNLNKCKTVYSVIIDFIVTGS